MAWRGKGEWCRGGRKRGGGDFFRRGAFVFGAFPAGEETGAFAEVAKEGVVEKRARQFIGARKKEKKISRLDGVARKKRREEEGKAKKRGEMAGEKREKENVFSAGQRVFPGAARKRKNGRARSFSFLGLIQRGGRFNFGAGSAGIFSGEGPLYSALSRQEMKWKPLPGRR